MPESVVGVRTVRAADRVRGRAALEFSAIFLACFAVLLRFPHGASLWHNLWAEDGFQFLKCRLARGPSCLGTSYEGYLQVAPRILVQFVPYFAVSDWAVANAILALTVDALAIALVYRSITWLIPSVWMRAALVLTISGSAASHWEVAGNLANLHWFLLFSGLFVGANQLASDSISGVTLRTSWLVLVCLSEALAPVVALACVVGMVLRRHRRGSWVRSDSIGTSVVVAAAIGQYVNGLVRPRYIPKGPHQTIRGVWHDYAQWVLSWGWAGPIKGHSFSLVFDSFAIVLIVVGLLLVAVRREQRSTAWLSIAAGAVIALGSPANLALSVVVNHAMTSRYVFLPFALIVTSVYVVVSRLYERIRWTRIAVGSLAGAVVIAVLLLGPYPPRVALEGPAWRTQVAAAKHDCQSQKRGASHLIAIPPRRLRTGVLLTCRRIDG